VKDMLYGFAEGERGLESGGAGFGGGGGIGVKVGRGRVGVGRHVFIQKLYSSAQRRPLRTLRLRSGQEAAATKVREPKSTGRSACATKVATT